MKGERFDAGVRALQDDVRLAVYDILASVPDVPLATTWRLWAYEDASVEPAPVNERLAAQDLVLLSPHA